MVNFYKRGERNKLIQLEDTLEQLAAVTRDIEMARAQLEALKPFPSYSYDFILNYSQLPPQAWLL